MDYSLDWRVPNDLAGIYGSKEDYSKSAYYLEQTLFRLSQSQGPGLADLIREIHQWSAVNYNELGQQRHFSPELCLRILYHLEKAWPYLEKQSKGDREALKPYVELARKTVGHYDVASMGVRMMEGFTRGRNPIDIPELILHPDGIDEATKLKAKDAIIARIKAFDEAQPSEYAVAPSDRSVEEVFKTLNTAYGNISSIHFQKYEDRGGTVELVEETWFERPDVVKSYHRHGGQEVWFLIRGNQLTKFDPKVKKITYQDTISRPDWLIGIYKLDTANLQTAFDLNVQKLTAPPAFLGSLYRDQSTMNLYLLTGKSKDPDGMGWPPVVRVEYVIDLDRGLFVATRKYGHGILGTGQEEELVRTEVVSKWFSSGSLFLPVSGRTEQWVDVFALAAQGPPAHRIDHTSWRFEYIAINEPFKSDEFDLSQYAVSEETTEQLTPMIEVYAKEQSTSNNEVDLGDKPMDGIEKSYYKNGKVSQEAVYKDGKLDGVKQYYESGALWKESNFKDDKLDGVTKNYYESGEFKSVMIYKEGKRHGTAREYYKNGTLKMEMNFVDDRENGTGKQYYESGTLQVEQSIKDGKPDGITKQYYENGKPEFEKTYKNGELVQSKEYDETGKLISEK